MLSHLISIYLKEETYYLHFTSEEIKAQHKVTCGGSQINK